MHRKIMLQRCFHASIVADIRPKLRYCTYGGDMSEGRQRSSASDKKKKKRKKVIMGMSFSRPFSVARL